METKSGEMTKFWLLIICSSWYLTINTSTAQSFIVVGHGYPVLRDTEKRMKLINALNQEDTEMIFFLGDCDFFQEEIYNDILTLNKKVYSIPGNHDIVPEKDRYQYIANIGYLDTCFQSGKMNFILLNSSADINSINLFLKKNMSMSDTMINIVLTHHRIWTDNKLSPIPYSDHKSYSYKQLDTNIVKEVDYFIAGNVNRIKKTYPRNIYSVDIFYNSLAYSCGMGYEDIEYVKFNYSNGSLVAIPNSLAKANKTYITKEKSDQSISSILPWLITGLSLVLLVIVLIKK